MQPDFRHYLAMKANSPRPLSVTRGTALYIGALLGPSLLLLPGLAAGLAGPASILAWTGLLGVSGLLARVFTDLGVRIRSGGVVAYTAAGLGHRAGRAVGWCFLAGVVCGAPVVCLIGGAYVSALIGGGKIMTTGVAAALLVAVVALTLSGARTTTSVQVGLVIVLMSLVVVAMAGSVPHARAANWAPFAPHGWAAVGSAASVLMLSFVGWEAIAPLIPRLKDPGRQLPRVIGAAFAITAVVYAGLATTTIAVLGPRAGTAVPLADLLRVATGSAGPAIAAVAAVALTLAATNAYISAAAALASDLRARRGPGQARRDPAEGGRGPGEGALVQLLIAGAGVVLLAAVTSGFLTTAWLVTLPTTMFLAVYLGCTASAARILTGPGRAAAVVSCAAVLAVLCFAGWALIVVVAVIGAAFAITGRKRRLPVVAPTPHFAMRALPATRPEVCGAGRGGCGECDAGTFGAVVLDGPLYSLFLCPRWTIELTGARAGGGGARAGGAGGFERRGQREEQLVQLGDNSCGLVDPGAGLRTTQSR
jgi:amino acid efflux transporter